MKQLMLFTLLLLFLVACNASPSDTNTPLRDASATVTQTPTRVFPSALPQVFATASIAVQSRTPDETYLATYVFGDATTSPFPTRTPSPIATPVILPSPTTDPIPNPTVEYHVDYDCLARGKVSSDRGLNIRLPDEEGNMLKGNIIKTLNFGDSILFYAPNPADEQDGWQWIRVVEVRPTPFNTVVLEVVGWTVFEGVLQSGGCR